MAHNEFGEASGDAEEGRIERGATWAATMPPVPIPQRTVRRARILREIQLRAQDVSATIRLRRTALAKTTRLAQRVAAVQADPERGSPACSMRRDSMARSCTRRCATSRRDLEPRTQPLVAINNLPVLGATAIDGVVGRMRELHGKGFEFIVACRPNNRQFANGFGDAYNSVPRRSPFGPRSSPIGRGCSALERCGCTTSSPRGSPPSCRCWACWTAGRRAWNRSRAPSHRCTRAYWGSAARPRFAVSDGMPARAHGRGLPARFRAHQHACEDSELVAPCPRVPGVWVDIEQGSYRCLARRSQAMGELCRHIVHTRPLFAMRAIKVLVAADDMDRAVYVAGMLENLKDRLACWPSTQRRSR